MSATINRDELKTKIDQGERFRLVETLPESEFQKNHLPGAVNMPPDRVQELAPKLLPDKNTEIVVYCANPTCDASEKAADELMTLGYTNVKRYRGGKQEWTEAGLPTTSK